MVEGGTVEAGRWLIPGVIVPERGGGYGMHVVAFVRMGMCARKTDW